MINQKTLRNSVEVSGKGFTLACETYQDARARWLEEQERQKEIESGQL